MDNLFVINMCVMNSNADDLIADSFARLCAGITIEKYKGLNVEKNKELSVSAKLILVASEQLDDVSDNESCDVCNGCEAESESESESESDLDAECHDTQEAETSARNLILQTPGHALQTPGHALQTPGHALQTPGQNQSRLYGLANHAYRMHRADRLDLPKLPTWQHINQFLLLLCSETQFPRELISQGLTLPVTGASLSRVLIKNIAHCDIQGKSWALSSYKIGMTEVVKKIFGRFGGKVSMTQQEFSARVQAFLNTKPDIQQITNSVKLKKKRSKRLA